MKARIFGLALAAAVAMPAAQAGVTQFNFTAVGANGATPWYSETRNTAFVQEGARTNILNGTYDKIETFGNWQYITHYATSSYDVTGYFQDEYIFNGEVAGPADGAKYGYISGTVTLDPSAASNMADRPATLTTSMMISGRYTPSFVPGFPTVSIPPSQPLIAVGHDSTDLVTLYSNPTFYNEQFTLTGYASDISLESGNNALAILLYVGPGMEPGMTLARISGPAYDLGTYHRTEETYLGYDVVQLPVPEPSTWAMLLAGVAIVGVARRRKTAA
jgi:hypothetical protein